MSKSELKQIILDCCNDVVFSYSGKESGITSEVKDYVPTFYAWHGSKTKEYHDVDELMTDSFFGGKSIADLIGKVDFVLA